MRLMVFLDLDNFKQSLFIRDKTRFYDFGKFQYFITRFLNKKLNFTKCLDESLIRVYAYTGEYAPHILRKIKDKNIQEEYKNKMKTQQRFFHLVKKFNFFELKTLPLKYEKGRIFQKGIDVRIAVDLLYHAFNDNFDVVVICSGDIDLVEAIRLAKSLGKKVIIVSHKNLLSKDLEKEADFFIDISKFNEEQLNEFSRLK